MYQPIDRPMHEPMDATDAPALGGPRSATEDVYAKLTVAAGVFFVVLEVSYFVSCWRDGICSASSRPTV